MVKQTQLTSTNILMRKRQKSNDGCAQVAVPVPWPVLPQTRTVPATRATRGHIRSPSHTFPSVSAHRMILTALQGPRGRRSRHARFTPEKAERWKGWPFAAHGFKRCIRGSYRPFPAHAPCLELSEGRGYMTGQRRRGRGSWFAGRWAGQNQQPRP